VCSKAGISEILISLAESFYILKRGDTYYIHDIIKDFALLKLKEDQKLYTEAQREAAGYYQERVSAENLLLLYHHLKEAGDHRGAVESIVYNIEYFWREGFWADVKGVLEESLDFSEDEKTIADIYYDLGSIVCRLGEWDKAIEYYEKDLEIFKKLGDLHGIAQTYNNLGLVYDSKGEWDKAIEYYEKSLEIKEKLGDKLNLMNVYNNLALWYEKMNQEEKAKQYCQKSEELRKQLGLEKS
jgi:tetratricopeptide (TPR) repeat protein